MALQKKKEALWLELGNKDGLQRSWRIGWSNAAL
jgi:hypothetical protein